VKGAGRWLAFPLAWRCLRARATTRIAYLSL